MLTIKRRSRPFCSDNCGEFCSCGRLKSYRRNERISYRQPVFLSRRTRAFFFVSNALVVISARAVAPRLHRVDRRLADLFALARLFSFSSASQSVEIQIILSNARRFDVGKRFRRAADRREKETFEPTRTKGEENEINSVEMLLRKFSSSSSRQMDRENPTHRFPLAERIY